MRLVTLRRERAFVLALVPRGLEIYHGAAPRSARRGRVAALADALASSFLVVAGGRLARRKELLSCSALPGGGAASMVNVYTFQVCLSVLRNRAAPSSLTCCPSIVSLRLRYTTGTACLYSTESGRVHSLRKI